MEIYGAAAIGSLGRERGAQFQYGFCSGGEGVVMLHAMILHLELDMSVDHHTHPHLVRLASNTYQSNSLV